jgi:hypothetical protein
MPRAAVATASKQRTICNRSDVSRETIRSWQKRRTRRPNTSTLRAIVCTLSITLAR